MRERKQLIISIDGEREWVEDLITALQMQCEEVKMDCEADGLSLTVDIREENNAYITPAMLVVSDEMSNLSGSIRDVREVIDRIRSKNRKEDTPRDIEDVLTEAEMEEIRRSPRQIRFRRKGGKK